MNCDEFSSRLSTVKQTYTRHAKPRNIAKSMVNEDHQLLNNKQSTKSPRKNKQSDVFQMAPIRIKEERAASPVLAVPNDPRGSPSRGAPRPNILRRTPAKEPSRPRTNSVNLSPVLYSPTLKSKNPLSGATASSQAHIITSYLKVVSPRKRSVGLQCKLQDVLKKVPVATAAAAASTSANQEQILCHVEQRSDDSIVVSHEIDGRLYCGVLLTDTLRVDVEPPSCSYFAEQLPSQYRKKLKAKLGLSFDTGCDSENSDTESSKMKFRKMKYSELKTMRATVSGNASSSAEKVAPKPSSAKPDCRNKPSSSKTSLVEVTNFLHNNLATSKHDESSARKSNDSTDPADQHRLENKKTKSRKLSGPSSNSNSSSPAKSHTETADKKVHASKPKFGEKFVKKPTSTPSSPAKSNPTTAKKVSSSHSHTLAMHDILAHNSSRLKYMDLEWPMWCPRKLQLCISPTRTGKPARFKLKQDSQNKRRRTTSDTDKEERFTVNNNPFGIGDVVIAKRIFAPGRPYWPARVLSVTGLTVCLVFYSTGEVMQLAKCNVEWYYDACHEHRIVYDPTKDSQEWRDALNQAERDLKKCIGLGSIVWALYEDEWWPARVIDIDVRNTHTVMWLDNNSIEPLALAAICPFLLAYNVRHSEEMASRHKSYRTAVDVAHREALVSLLESS